MSQYLILVLFLMGWSTTAHGLAHMAHIKCPQWTLNDLVQISPIVVEGTVVSNGQNSPINGKFEVISGVEYRSKILSLNKRRGYLPVLTIFHC